MWIPTAWAPFWMPAPGRRSPACSDAIAQLHHSGWHVVQATNQPRLGHGSLDIGELNACTSASSACCIPPEHVSKRSSSVRTRPIEGCSLPQARRRHAPADRRPLRHRAAAKCWVIGQCSHPHPGLGRPWARMWPWYSHRLTIPAPAPVTEGAQVPRYASWHALAPGPGGHARCVQPAPRPELGHGHRAPGCGPRGLPLLIF